MRATAFLFFALLALASSAGAHRLAPSFLSLEVSADGHVDVLWKTAQVVARGAQIKPVLPEACHRLGEAEVRAEGTAWVTRIQMNCGSEGLIGQRIAVTGLEESGTDALVRIAFADGREVRTILSRTAPTMEVPEKESPWRVFSDYLQLGVGHLLGGPDHLLFVLGLMLLMPTTRKLLAAVTAFTLGHSLTLALAALGILGVPQGLVELTIAATLVVLARETLLPRPEASALVRRPWIAPAAFGLVHGLGFAGALAELGLPGHAIPLALFAFNVGIEFGQIGVVVAGWWAVRALARRQSSLPGWIAETPATVIGTLGVFWCLQRATAWLLP
ncbi:MAG: HupE/UreJ family protein [bacterium]|nr:HupE/UreJ family protein [bacterium]